jgi:hypothetical protein
VATAIAPCKRARYRGKRRWPIEKLCSHDFPLAQVHDAILATAGRGTEGAIHVTVSPHREG